MTNPYHATCAELIEAVLSNDSHIDCMQIARRARALLAQPVAVGPTLKEVSEFIDKEAPKSWNFGAQHHDVMRIVLAAITRWGHPMPQPVAESPADGEVAELVEWLITLRDHDLRHVAPYSHPSIAHWHDFLTRAADLLERPTPQPVATSERLPGPEDCDEQGRCWVFDDQLGLPSWTLIRVQGRSLAPDMYWRPANALPTPEATNE